MDRRNFIRSSSSLATGLLFSEIGLNARKNQLQKPVIRKIDANEKVNLACIGISNRGEEAISELYKYD